MCIKVATSIHAFMSRQAPLTTLLSMPDDGLAIVLRCWAAAVISDEPCVVILMGNVCKKMKELVATIFDDAWWKASIASIHTDRPLFAATLLKAQTIDPSIRYVHLQLIHTYVCLDCSSSAPIRSPDVVCKVFAHICGADLAQARAAPPRGVVEAE